MRSAFCFALALVFGALVAASFAAFIELNADPVRFNVGRFETLNSSTQWLAQAYPGMTAVGIIDGNATVFWYAAAVNDFSKVIAKDETLSKYKRVVLPKPTDTQGMIYLWFYGYSAGSFTYYNLGEMTEGVTTSTRYANTKTVSWVTAEVPPQTFNAVFTMVSTSRSYPTWVIRYGSRLGTTVGSCSTSISCKIVLDKPQAGVYYVGMVPQSSSTDADYQMTVNFNA